MATLLLSGAVVRIVLQVQFLLVTLHSATALFIKDCNFPKMLAGVMMLHYSFMFILFLDFYKKAYRRKTE